MLGIASRPAPRLLSAAAGAPTNGPPARDYKVALVTGANAGIGFVTARELTKQGYYVVMGCRDQVRCDTDLMVLVLHCG
jgi:NAD(P)H-hydrate repair Nnr-like enzyme with NAD(P)H-hydrate epimerase domain